MPADEKTRWTRRLLLERQTLEDIEVVKQFAKECRSGEAITATILKIGVVRFQDAIIELADGEDITATTLRNIELADRDS